MSSDVVSDVVMASPAHSVPPPNTRRLRSLSRHATRHNAEGGARAVHHINPRHLPPSMDPPCVDHTTPNQPVDVSMATLGMQVQPLRQTQPLPLPAQAASWPALPHGYATKHVLRSWMS